MRFLCFIALLAFSYTASAIPAGSAKKACESVFELEKPKSIAKTQAYEIKEHFVSICKHEAIILVTQINLQKVKADLFIHKTQKMKAARKSKDKTALFINGSFFEKDKKKKLSALGFFKVDNKVINEKILAQNKKTWLIYKGIVAIDSQGKIQIFDRDKFDSVKQKNAHQALQAGPFLIQNGKDTRQLLKKYNGFKTADQRQILALTKDGNKAFLITTNGWFRALNLSGNKSYYSGLSWDQAITFLKTLPIETAINLDGGSSVYLGLRKKGSTKKITNMGFSGLPARKIHNHLSFSEK